jgi:RNA polymerase sigma-70 factor (ECF subfamily)
MVKFRLNDRVLGRVDPDDVLQEASLEVTRRVDDYLKDPQVPPFVWMRMITLQKTIDVHRRHLGAGMRNAAQDVRLGPHVPWKSTSLSLAAQLVASITSPSEALLRQEALQRMGDALDELSEQDREILVLRHLEELSNNEAAAVLGVDKSAATKRYIRALKRLREAMEYE